MAANQFGASTFPIILGANNDGTFVRDVVQSFLSQEVSLQSFFHAAADRIFFNGAYPGPLGGPTGEIGQVVTNNYVYEDTSNSVFAGAKSNLVSYHWNIDIIQYINFTERKFADASNILFNRVDTSPPHSRVGLSFNIPVTDTIGFNDHDGSGVEPLYDALKRVYPVSNSLGFSEVLLDTPQAGDLFDTVFDDAQMLDTVGTDFGGDTAQTGPFKQSVSFRIQGSACPEKEYNPHIGTSDDTTYDEFSNSAPVLGEGVLTLTHPRVSPTLTLVLKNPSFGNTDVLRFTKVDRVTRGGDRKIFSDLGWSSTQSFELTIENICETNVTIDEILGFLNASLGEEIGLLDWEGRNWKGIIVAPETDVTPTVGGHSLQLVFEGELV